MFSNVLTLTLKSSLKNKLTAQRSLNEIKPVKVARHVLLTLFHTLCNTHFPT